MIISFVLDHNDEFLSDLDGNFCRSDFVVGDIVKISTANSNIFEENNYKIISIVHEINNGTAQDEPYCIVVRLSSVE